MGIKYLTFPFRTNVTLHNAMQKGWRRYPFGKLGLVCDPLPEDKNFLVMVSHSFPNEGLDVKQMDVSVTSRLDFLYGLRLKAPGKRFEQYQEATDRVAKYVRWAHENLFFATIFTHETLINYLKLHEFKRVVRNIDHRLRPEKSNQLLLQDIADYFRRRMGATIDQVKSSKGEEWSIIKAEPKTKVHIAIYHDRGRSILTKQKLICFNGQSSKKVSLAA